MSITIADVSVQSPRFIRASWDDFTIGIVTGIFTRILFEVIRTYCSIFQHYSWHYHQRTDGRSRGSIVVSIWQRSHVSQLWKSKDTVMSRAKWISLTLSSSWNFERRGRVSRQVHAKYILTKNKSKPVESLTRKLSYALAFLLVMKNRRDGPSQQDKKERTGRWLQIYRQQIRLHYEIFISL